jgi:hypothetical protein
MRNADAKPFASHKSPDIIRTSATRAATDCTVLARPPLRRAKHRGSRGSVVFRLTEMMDRASCSYLGVVIYCCDTVHRIAGMATDHVLRCKGPMFQRIHFQPAIWGRDVVCTLSASPHAAAPRRLNARPRLRAACRDCSGASKTPLCGGVPTRPCDYMPEPDQRLAGHVPLWGGVVPKAARGHVVTCVWIESCMSRASTELVP